MIRKIQDPEQPILLFQLERRLMPEHPLGRPMGIRVRSVICPKFIFHPTIN
jgi:hypothetical protein